MTAGSFYDRPDLYDLAMPPDPRAEAFYVAEARRRGGPVLDLACGSGRMTLPLARAGFDVVGVDESPAMLAAARAKAEAAGVAIELVQADMRALDLVRDDGGPRTFGLATIFANSLLHLHETADIRRCLRAVARHLRPGGALAFDIFIPSPRFMVRTPDERREIKRFHHDTLGPLTLEETTRYDPYLQVGRSTWFWSAPDRPDFFSAPLDLRWIFPQELPLLLELEGFRLRERYGDFDLRPLSPHGRIQVCVCEPI